MKIAVIIPAGGSSTRFGARNKLAEDLGGRPLLLRTVEFFTKREDIQEIVVVGPSEYFSDFKERFGPALGFHGVKIVAGGSTRTESVTQGLAVVSSEVDFVMVHDAARPALNDELLDRILLASNSYNAVIPALPLSGTIKRAQTQGTNIADEDAVVDSILGAESQTTVDAFQVQETIERAGLWEMQTPQCFSLSLLKRGYAQENIENCADDAQVIENLGEAVYLIEGDSRNIKVTTPSDYNLVKAILGVKGSSERPAHKRF